MSIREVRESSNAPLAQGSDEQIAYTLVTTPWGGSPTSPVVTLFDTTDDAYTDVSAGCLEGAPQLAGDNLITPLVQALVAGHQYRLEMRWQFAGNTFEAYLRLAAEH